MKHIEPELGCRICAKLQNDPLRKAASGEMMPKKPRPILIGECGSDASSALLDMLYIIYT